MNGTNDDFSWENSSFPEFSFYEEAVLQDFIELFEVNSGSEFA